MSTQQPTFQPGDAPEFEVPAGDHPLEVAARRGIGPLSPRGEQVWHGGSAPCVSCGQLVARGASECDDCGQDLSEEMLEKMRAHAGPWYVLEHLRPFPGVSLERIIKQIRRGLISEVSIVRGPSTDYQWRFAAEAPGLCRYFGKCWHCHHEVGPADTYCPSCLSYLSFEKPNEARPAAQAEAAVAQPEEVVTAAREAVGVTGAAKGSTPGGAAVSAAGPAVVGPSNPAKGVAVSSPVKGAPPSAELAQLADAVQSMQRLPRADESTGPSRSGWIAAGFVVVAMAILLTVISVRSHSMPSSAPETTQVAE